MKELCEYHNKLADILGKCMGRSFGRGINVIKIRGDAKVPEKYAHVLMGLVAKLNRLGTKNGGKTRFRVQKRRRTNGYHIKDILDLYKRTTDIVLGHNAFALQKPQKIVVGHRNGKRIQKYIYTFKWRISQP